MALEERKKEKVEITHDMLIGDIIQAKPESINTFLSIFMD